MHFFFLKKKKKNGTKCINVYKCVSHTPKLKFHIVPNVKIPWKERTREDGELSGLAWLIAHPQTWTEVPFVPDKHNTKIILENKKKLKKIKQWQVYIFNQIVQPLIVVSPCGVNQDFCQTGGA